MIALHDKSARRKPMVSVLVQCPFCQSTEVIKAGKQANGAQRYQCQNDRCDRRIFLLQYQDRGRALEIRRQVIDMALNGSGIRDTARVLRISPTTGIAILKKSPCCNTSTLRWGLLRLHTPSASRQDAPPSWMKCGVSSGLKRGHGGCGMRLIITAGESWPMWWAAEKMQSS